jgi:hypothetical protein
MGPDSTVQVLFGGDDKRLWPEWADTDGLREIDLNAVFPVDGYRNGWWPRARGLDSTGNDMLEALYYDRPEITKGRQSRMGISGVTRDVYGSPLGSCLVKLFKTADGLFPGTKDTKIDEMTSDPTTGAYLLSTPYYPDTHYVVSYKVGTPDVEGTTVNTLIGA